MHRNSHKHTDLQAQTYTHDYNNRYTLKWSDKMTTDILGNDSESNARLPTITSKKWTLYLIDHPFFSPR